MRPTPVLRSAALLLLLAACSAPRQLAPREAPPQAAEPIRLTIVATNDLHGWLAPREARLQDGTLLRTGGFAVFGGYVARLRETTPDGVVLVDAGDLFQGTLLSNLSEGAAVIEAYNALGYDATAVGNHEFDFGPAGPHSSPLDPGEDPLGALAARAAEARFPLLARNIYVGSTSTRPDFLAPQGFTIVERQGLKIGLLGLSTPTTSKITNPVNVASLMFTELAAEALAGATELRAAGADLVVALVHAGGNCSDLSQPESLESCDRDGELFQLLEALPHGLFDAVASGHTHSILGHIVNGMPVIQSAGQGTRFGTIELSIDPATRRPIAGATRINAGRAICEQVFAGTTECDSRKWKPGTRLEPARFAGGEVAADPNLVAVIAPHLERVTAEQRRSLGIQVPVKLTRDYRAESPLGNTLADALRKAEKADLALLNSGGLRADLPAGELTYGALFEVLPFDNAIATLSLTGAQVVTLLETLLSSDHGVPQTSGVRFEVALCEGRARVKRITLASGKPLDPKALYKLTTSDFLALGGDGLGPFLATIPDGRKDLGRSRAMNMRDALGAWLQATGRPLQGGVDGRMKLVTDASQCTIAAPRPGHE